MKGFINEFKGWSKFEYLWLIVAIGSIFGLELIWKDTVIGTISAVSNILCVILVAKNRISSYFWGLIGVLTYGYIAYSNRIFGDAMLNFLYYLPMQFVGYFQ